jgi:hypothetical protein
VTPAVPRTTRIGLAVLATALALLPAAFAGEARAARGMELALQDDSVFVSRASYFRNTDRAYSFLRPLGVTRLKINVLWAYSMQKSQYNARTKPSNISYNFAAYDRTIDQAAARGIRVHVAFTGPAPRWATGDRRRVSAFKPNAAAFGEFVAAAAQHFNGRVDRYSIWNEPNWKSWLGPIANQASLYRGLYSRGYAAIKKADPRAKVLIGETSPLRKSGWSQAPLAFLRSLACVNKSFKRVRKCTPLRADGYAHHPYDFRHSPSYVQPNPDNVTMGNLRNLTRTLDRLSRAGALRKNGGGRMPVYLTEYGYFSSGHRAVPPRVRVPWLKQAYTIALRNSRVKSQLQYVLVAPPARSRASFFNLALLTTSGKKYPNYNALLSWYRSHRGSVKRPGGPINLQSAP